MIAHRYATAADIDQFYEERPYQTMRALVVTLDEKPVAVIGLALEGDRFQAFSEFKPELTPHLKSMAVLRAIKAGQRMIQDAILPVVAYCKGSPMLIERMGFMKVGEGAYLWPFYNR